MSLYIFDDTVSIRDVKIYIQKAGEHAGGKNTYDMYALKQIFESGPSRRKPQLYRRRGKGFRPVSQGGRILQDFLSKF